MRLHQIALMMLALAVVWTPLPAAAEERAAPSPVDSAVTALADQMNAAADAVIQRVAAAAIERRAFADMQMAFTAARQDFDRTPEYRQATDEAELAYQNFQEVRSAALSPVWSGSQYQNLMRRREQLSDQLAGLRESDPEHPAIPSLAADILNVGAAAGDLEYAALAASPEVTQARGELMAAARRLSDVEAEYRYQTPRRPEIVQARDAYRDARIAALTAYAAAFARIEVANAGLDLARRATRDDVYRNPMIVGWPGNGSFTSVPYFGFVGYRHR